MRILALILGLLGGLAAAFLGLSWLSDASKLRETIDNAQSLGVDTGEVQKLVMAGYLLLGSFLAGIVGAILAMKRRGKMASVVMILGAAAPGIFAPKAVIFTFLLLVGGLVCLAVKPAKREEQRFESAVG